MEQKCYRTLGFGFEPKDINIWLWWSDGFGEEDDPPQKVSSWVWLK